MPWEVRACDNMDPAAGLGSMPDRSVDVVITDPPYSPKVHACSRRGVSSYRKQGSVGCAVRVRELGFPPLMPEERAAMAQALARITRRWLVIFADHEGTHGWRADLEAAGLEYVRTCVWIKPGATPQLTGDRPACGHECLVIAHQTRRGRPMKKRWNAAIQRRSRSGSCASWSPTSPSRASSCAIRMPAVAPRASRARSSAGASSAGSATWPWPRWRSAGCRDCALSRCQARSRCSAE
jgi:hypothetical protein